MTDEQREEAILNSRWRNSEEKRILEEYAGKPIEEVPKEYREKIAKLRSYGLGEEEKTTYEQVIKFLDTHNGQLMHSNFSENGNQLTRKEMTEEQIEEINLYQRWNKSLERKILKEYAGKSIDEVPEEYKEKIAKLRSYGLGEEEKTTYEQVIEFLETHNGQLMRGALSESGRQLTRKEMTEEQRNEMTLYQRWKYSKERKILEEHAGKPIEEVPKRYRDKIAKLRSYGLGEKEKTTYEQVIDFLEIHNGKLMKSKFVEDGKILTRKEMTDEQRNETALYQRWNNSEERKILNEYAGKPIEEVPKEYRDKITKLRSYGLGELEKTVYERVIEFLQNHDGQLMHSCFRINGQKLTIAEMTEEQRDEVNLYAMWRKAEEKMILEEYAEKAIEEVPEEYRDKIARLREFGLGNMKSKLSQAKKKRDEAKDKNDQAKELEERVEEQLKKRGQVHEEQ